MPLRFLACALVLALLGAGCGSETGGRPASRDDTSAPSAGRPAQLPQGSEPVALDPSDFTTEIDNAYWPMVPGSRWVYRERAEGGDQRVEVTVTDRTKRIANGVEATVIHDVVTQGGELVEETFDWYAQDKAGNIWYLGEDTTEYENGKPSTTEGSWEAGVDGAQAGIIMPARPQPGVRYRQEYYEGEAEDAARVLMLDERVDVPFGDFEDVLVTEDVNTLVPGGAPEHKYYARGVGLVLVTDTRGRAREELVDFDAGAG